MSAPEILRELHYRPRVAPELLREVLGVELPRYDGVRAEALHGGPTGAAAPLVIVLSQVRTPVHAIVVDALDTCDSPARLRWPQWIETVRARLGVATHAMVVTVDDVVERWAKQPVHLDDGRVFQPHVIGPSAIPSDGRATPVLVLMTLASKITPRA
ncbi:MAG: hypothetical protein HYV09_06440 [Deltaproteobacteria bacterium]|nr:hypothetical protein [Deltaproteobacteria bacterium]